MERYVEQLLEDIASATENVNWPFRERESDIHDWISDEEEEQTAPRLPLQEWTGIRNVQLPPTERLSYDQVRRLLEALQLTGAAWDAFGVQCFSWAAGKCAAGISRHPRNPLKQAG